MELLKARAREGRATMKEEAKETSKEQRRACKRSRTGSDGLRAARHRPLLMNLAAEEEEDDLDVWAQKWDRLDLPSAANGGCCEIWDGMVFELTAWDVATQTRTRRLEQKQQRLLGKQLIEGLEAQAIQGQGLRAAIANLGVQMLQAQVGILRLPG